MSPQSQRFAKFLSRLSDKANAVPAATRALCTQTTDETTDLVPDLEVEAAVAGKTYRVALTDSCRNGWHTPWSCSPGRNEAEMITKSTHRPRATRSRTASKTRLRQAWLKGDSDAGHSIGRGPQCPWSQQDRAQIPYEEWEVLFRKHLLLERHLAGRSVRPRDVHPRSSPLAAVGNAKKKHRTLHAMTRSRLGLAELLTLVLVSHARPPPPARR